MRKIEKANVLAPNQNSVPENQKPGFNHTLTGFTVNCLAFLRRPQKIWSNLPQVTSKPWGWLHQIFVVSLEKLNFASRVFIFCSMIFKLLCLEIHNMGSMYMQNLKKKWWTLFSTHSLINSSFRWHIQKTLKFKLLRKKGVDDIFQKSCHTALDWF